MDIDEKLQLDEIMKSHVVDLSKIKPKENTNVDLSQFDKKPVKIDRVTIQLVRSTFTKSKKQYVLKVESVPVVTIGEGDDVIELRASELFNLNQIDEEGKNPILESFPVGEKSNLGQFIRDLKIDVSELDSLQKLMDVLKGKEALIKVFEKEKNGVVKKYMRFRY